MISVSEMRAGLSQLLFNSLRKNTEQLNQEQGTAVNRGKGTPEVLGPGEIEFPVGDSRGSLNPGTF